MNDHHGIQTKNFSSLHKERPICMYRLLKDESECQCLRDGTTFTLDDRKRLKFVRYADGSSIIRQPKYILASSRAGEYWCGWNGMWSRLD